jgi:hypothetical protein
LVARVPSVNWVDRKISVAAVAAALVSFAPIAVGALELVPGGYGAVPAELAQPPQDTVDLSGQTSPPALALDFTPRGGAGLWARPDASEEAGPRLRFDLTVRAGGSDAIERFGLGTSRDALLANSSPSPTPLTVGGAMRWSDWSVGGGLGRAQILGENVDLLAATLGYGRVTAELAYGQSESVDGPPKDVLMLSTDLAAWSWLTLESDLALGSRSGTVDGERERNREPVAAGRFGLRLNF